MSGSVCSIEHQDFSIYSQILSLLICHSVPYFVHILRHCIGLSILCKYVSHAT